MKIKDGYIMKEIAGSKVVMAIGAESNNFNGIITFNEVGAEVFSMLDGSNSIEKIIEVISEKYDVSGEIVKEDVLNVVEKMKEHGLIEE